MSYMVSRQSNWYDDGAYSVEIATQPEFAGPGALARCYHEDFSEYEDPREAAEAAIRLAGRWRTLAVGGLLPFRCFTIAGNSMVYATVNDAMSAPELREWAGRVFERLAKCVQCGGLIAGDAWYPVECMGEEEFGCCSESCADSRAYADTDMEEAA